MAYEFSRNIQDAALSVSKALPAAGANNNSSTIDLGAGGNHQPEEIEIEIAIPATPNLADAKNVTIKLQDSTDDSSYADTDPLVQVKVTGAGGAGAAAKTKRIKIPSNTRRYVQFNQAVDASGGDSTAVSVTYKLLT